MSRYDRAAMAVNHASDVVVLGTGAAGLMAAIAAHDSGASVAVYEKAELIGGTSALSGGVCWLPCNPLAAAAGAPDSREEALAYLHSLSHGLIVDELAAAFVDGSPQLVDYLQSHTPLRFRVLEIPDYHPEHPGGRPKGGRSLEPTLTAFDELGEWASRIGWGEMSDSVTGDVSLMTSEAARGGGSGHIDEQELARRRARRVNGRGRGLIGALLKACVDRGIFPVTGARATRLRLDDGRITGAHLECRDGSVDVHARHGVVLATGGFEWDPDLVRSFLRGPMQYPASIPTNTGDGLRMAMRIGVQLGNMREAWWMPVARLPGVKQYGEQKVALILRERALPGTIMVNRRGVRFVNEATNYNAMGGALHHFDPMSFEYANLPCWVVFDSRLIERYGFLGKPPGSSMPEWVPSAPTIATLADRLGIASGALVATIERWNAHIGSGQDPEFNRGASAYDGFNGDMTRYPGRESTLGPIDEPPFYALQLESSTLGTNGGPRTNEYSEVLDVDGIPIPGLYAAGNVMASPTGMVYGGAGGTLGPALVFGYIAGRRVAHH